jgi:hypothetical protein
LQEDAAAIELCTDALKVVIGWGAGKVLDHYYAKTLEDKLNQFDAALKGKLSAPATTPADKERSRATLNSVDQTKLLLLNTQRQRVNLNQWKLQTDTAINSLQSAMTAQPVGSQTAALLTDSISSLRHQFLLGQQSAAQNHLVLSPLLAPTQGAPLRPTAVAPPPAPTSTQCPP